MKEVVGIKFKKPGKIYFFDPAGLKLNLQDMVIADTANGEEFAKIAMANKLMPDEKIIEPLRKVIRLANKKDIKQNEENKAKEREAFNIAIEKIKKHKLPMKLIDVEYKFDRTKILFYFTADGRIDFRELVKDLAAIFKTRIELRQIGVRDEVRRMGGNGICGRELCCCSFLNNFDAVSIKMAKEQNMSLNPSKISGLCGRLMCCLKYEQEAYEDKLQRLPKVGSIVGTLDGEGVVDNVEILKENVRVKFEDDDGYHYKKYKAEEVKLIKESETEEIDLEEKENEKELEELEKLAKDDILVDDDM
ncbi:MAG TPA: stage 0 sporulation family protein [Clostridiaceae bacterium]|nr:stage 0 sporulation family protein [Clostridium sp.]MEE0127859.1 stage 0 sporulation family protein [Clostridia bacterium]HJJ11804.1 stage 0 sporulation family protein [Clostridiaceae bacterium]